MKDSMRLLVLLLFMSVVVAVQLRSKPKLRRGVPSEVICRPNRNQAHSILYILFCRTVV